MRSTAALNQFVTQHPVMVSALGLSPLLARSETLYSGLVMGLAFVIALLSSVAIVGALRRFVPWSYRLIFILLVTATIVTILDRFMQAWLFELHQALGIYVPLMAMNALLLVTLEETALRRPLWHSLKTAAATGSAVFMILVVAGLLRQWLGQGGAMMPAGGLPIMGTAAGAFLTLGCLIAAVRFLTAQSAEVVSTRRQ